MIFYYKDDCPEENFLTSSANQREIKSSEDYESQIHYNQKGDSNSGFLPGNNIIKAYK